MQIRTFRAATVNEALQLVKKELGPDAVILKNERVTISPTKSYVEIMAATEPGLGDEAPGKEVAAADLRVCDDIKEIKSLLSMLISSKDYFTQLQIQQPLAEIYHSLLARGLDEKQTFLLLKKTLSESQEKTFKKKDIIKAFCRQLLSKVTLINPFRNEFLAKSKLFTFLGPTGVGKTTTLAKLAAHLKIKRQLDVGVISLDTYRIGAVDQLQHYAEILNVPMLVAQNAADLANAKDRFRNYDVVLVDTIGKNFLHRKHISELQAILNGDNDAQHLLVLSATAKDEDLRQTLRHFAPIKIRSLIFTKIDETLSPGNLLNQLLRFSYPLSYLGTGQCVPEDIVLASHKNLISFLFPAERDVKEEEQYAS
jgi:flagellar biosynthesis protein FlhF